MILIESQWNLKGGYSNNDPDIVKNINRITVEFKGFFVTCSNTIIYSY